MKLLFDANISQHLVEKLKDEFPGSAHVKHFGLQSADDEIIWNLAITEGFTIVSKDSDFHQRSFLFGPPPKVIWIRRGNSSSGPVRLCRVLSFFCQLLMQGGRSGKFAFIPVLLDSQRSRTEVRFPGLPPTPGSAHVSRADFRKLSMCMDQTFPKLHAGRARSQGNGVPVELFFGKIKKSLTLILERKYR